MAWIWSRTYKYLHKPTSSTFICREPAAHLYHIDPDSFTGILFAHSHLAHELTSLGEDLWKRITGRPVFPFERRGDFYLAWKPFGWERVRDVTGEMHSLLPARGVSLVVALSNSDQVNERTG